MRFCVFGLLVFFYLLIFWFSTSRDGQFGVARGVTNPTPSFNGLRWGSHHPTHIIKDINAHSKHTYAGFSKYTLCPYIYIQPHGSFVQFILHLEDDGCSCVSKYLLDVR